MDKEQLRKIVAMLWQLGEDCRTIAYIAQDFKQYDEAQALCEQGDAIDEIAAKLGKLL